MSYKAIALSVKTIVLTYKKFVLSKMFFYTSNGSFIAGLRLLSKFTCSVVRYPHAGEFIVC